MRKHREETGSWEDRKSGSMEVGKTESRKVKKLASQIDQQSGRKKVGKIICLNKIYMVFKFEKLIVWQKAVDLSDFVNQLTKTFPKDEIFILTSQIKRAADSVSLNIAEGSTGQSNAEFARFLGIALRSDIEVVACIYLAKKRGYIKEQDFTFIYNLCEEILVMINSLRNSLKQ